MGAQSHRAGNGIRDALLVESTGELQHGAVHFPRFHEEPLRVFERPLETTVDHPWGVAHSVTSIVGPRGYIAGQIFNASSASAWERASTCSNRNSA